LYGKKKLLSPAVYSQLEACIYKELIDSFEMFAKLNINIIRYLKNNSLYTKGKFEILRGGEIDSVVFVVKGSLTFYDSNMKLYNIYVQNEFYGFGKFMN